uniref:Putative plant transposon protein domain-containing protein n=1 Tax=Solanum tuberosum TaxID=4113 RepID=M1DQL3_SOLTU
MSSTQRSGKAVASSSRKRVRTGTTIPPAPAVPRGQTQRYGAMAVTSEGKKWYKSHTEAKYFSDVILDDINLEREFPHIMCRLQELHMGFIFQDPSECNVSVVREFYANWKPDARSHFVIVRGVEVPLTPSAINQILGTVDAPSDVLTGINISPHGRARVPEESVDYMAPLFTTPLDVTKTKRPENMHGPTLTTAERNRRDEMIMALMFGMEMLRHRNGCRASTQEQLDEVATKYPLNEQAEELLGLGRAFIEPVWDDVPTDEDKRRTMSDSESDSKEEEGDLLAIEGTGGDVDMDE